MLLALFFVILGVVFGKQALVGLPRKVTLVNMLDHCVHLLRWLHCTEAICLYPGSCLQCLFNFGVAACLNVVHVDLLEDGALISVNFFLRQRLVYAGHLIFIDELLVLFGIDTGERVLIHGARLILVLHEANHGLITIRVKIILLINTRIKLRQVACHSSRI